MTQEHGIAKGDALQKIGSVGLILGFLLVTIGGVWPLSVDFGDIQTGQRIFGEHAVLLQACALLVAFGCWAAMIGMAGIHRSIVESGNAWARLGFTFLVMGMTLWTLGMSLDISYPAALLNLQAAPDAGKEAARNVVAMLSPAGLGRGLFPLEVIVIWMAYAFMGIGMIQSGFYPRWLGWAGVALGIVGVPLGIVQTFTGREPSLNIFTMLIVVTTFWFLAVGIWVARKAWKRAG
jgi:hypothetical protein